MPLFADGSVEPAYVVTALVFSTLMALLARIFWRDDKAVKQWMAIASDLNAAKILAQNEAASLRGQRVEDAAKIARLESENSYLRIEVDRLSPRPKGGAS
jgi:hypothetical protein